MKNGWVALAVGLVLGAAIVLLVLYLPLDRRAAKLRADAERLVEQSKEQAMEYQRASDELRGRVGELEDSLKRERATVERLSLRVNSVEKRNSELIAILRRLGESSSGLAKILEAIRSEVQGGLRDIDLLGKLMGSGVQR